MTKSASVVGQRQRVHVALAQARGDARAFELGAGEPKHLRRFVDADRLHGARAEQLDHPAGAGADVDQAAEVAAAQAPARSRARPRCRRHGASGSSPRPRRGRRNSARRPRPARPAPHRGGPSPARRSRWSPGRPTGRSARAMAAVRSGAAIARNTQLPSLRRSTMPASARILTWRETRGWLWSSR